MVAGCVVWRRAFLLACEGVGRSAVFAVFGAMWKMEKAGRAEGDGMMKVADKLIPAFFFISQHIDAYSTSPSQALFLLNAVTIVSVLRDSVGHCRSG